MKLGGICVLGLIIATCLSPVTAGLDDDIVNLLEEFRVRMCHPFPKWGIPALDPFQITHKEVYLDNSIFKDFSASVTNLKAIGLSDFIINEIKITTLTRKFTFDLTFPLTSVESLYTAQGSLAYILNLVGDDQMIGRIKEVRIVVTGAIKVGLSFGIKNLKIELFANNLFMNMGELIEHERINNFVHNVINELMLELVGDFWDDYGESYTSKIENIINAKMSGYTLMDIIAIITGSGSDEPIFGDNPPGDCKDIVEPSVILHQRN